jgi:regulator of replication initiation timing
MESKATKPSNHDAKRWFSTGFMAGGVTSVDAEKHTLHGAVLIRPGEALGHGYWIDKEFCQSVAALSAQGKSALAGLKARFGHPNMCSEALGTFLGRWKNVTIDEHGFVRGDLHLSSTASESPKGDLRKYVEELAAKEPDHFGASIVFSSDPEAEDAFYTAHTVETEGSTGKAKRFQSPDPANVKNLPHARLSELHAADLVDDPAATDGMFSGAGGAALAAQMTEWLDTHPEVFAALQEPGVVDTLQRYSKELKPFVERYSASAATVETTTTVIQTDKPEQPQPIEEKPSTPAESEAEPTQEKPAESGDPVVEKGALTAQVGSLAVQIEQLTVERDGAVKRAESAEASNATLNAERDELAKRITKMESDLQASEQKLKAYESGQAPVSSVHAESITSGTIFERARAKK